jgi:hypothetical protein
VEKRALHADRFALSVLAILFAANAETRLGFRKVKKKKKEKEITK